MYQIKRKLRIGSKGEGLTPTPGQSAHRHGGGFDPPDIALHANGFLMSPP